MSRDKTHTAPQRRILLDRFIPNRSAMDFDFAHNALMEGRKGKDETESHSVISESRDAYLRGLAETMNQNRTRILAFGNKPPVPRVASVQPVKPRRYISQTYERKMDAPDIVDDFHLNLLDWGSANVLAIALGHTVYLWDASGDVTELVTVPEETGPVTSISWAPDGRHVAVGLNNSQVQLWDSASNRNVRTLKGGHRSRVGSLAWNNHILTTGGMDGRVINNDVRIRSHLVQTYRGHTQEVCGLKWSGSGMQLASGGNDNGITLSPLPEHNGFTGLNNIHLRLELLLGALSKPICLQLVVVKVIGPSSSGTLAQELA